MVTLYLSGWLQESLSQPGDSPADGPVVQVVWVAVHVPLHRLLDDVQVVGGIEIARSEVSVTNESVVMLHHSWYSKKGC